MKCENKKTSYTRTLIFFAMHHAKEKVILLTLKAIYTLMFLLIFTQKQFSE